MWAPPRPGSTTALHLLRDELDGARARGETFAACWPSAVTVALADLSGVERQEWRWALERTRSTWERCFERLPAGPAELALAMISDARDVRLPDVACEHCGAELVRPAVVRGRVSVYCDERCRRDASMVRTGVSVPARRSLAA